MGQLLPAILGQASAGGHWLSLKPAGGGKGRGDVTLVHNSCLQLYFPGKERLFDPWDTASCNSSLGIVGLLVEGSG